MGLFKSKAEKELDAIIERLNMNMSNNYKDNAQDDMKELENLFQEMVSEEKIKGKVLSKYDSILEEYREKLKGYSHKDQKPFWH
ncbi:MAG: hypothetical protein K6F00_09870 [Lachnospiraceae bacterium]|nr:hypothetical protein [Lachnospiraceae bacterium]